jgi:uncharacterized membrane protein YuzA (DUF378 family)
MLTEENRMKVVNIVTLLLIIVGGVNWGLVGLFGLDLVAAIFGAGSAPARLAYLLVGISALLQIGPLAKAFTAEEPLTQTVAQADPGFDDFGLEVAVPRDLSGHSAR